MDYYRMAAFSYGMTATDYDNPNRTAMQQRLRQERIDTYRAAVGVPNFPVVTRAEDLERSIAKEKSRGKFDIQLARFGMTEAQFRENANRGIAAMTGFEQKLLPLRDAESELYRPVRYVSADERAKDLKLPHDYQYSRFQASRSGPCQGNVRGSAGGSQTGTWDHRYLCRVADLLTESGVHPGHRQSHVEEGVWFCESSSPWTRSRIKCSFPIRP